MAGAGYRDWSPGDVPTATQFDQYLQEQTVMVFADASARDTALSIVKAEGMVAYLLSTNSLTVYTGSSWSTVGPVHGALTDWTPTITQLGSVTFVDTYSRYQRIGRRIECWFRLDVTGSGTSGNPVVIGGLPATAATSALMCGYGEAFDSDDTAKYGCGLYLASTTTVDFRVSALTQDTDNRLGVVGITQLAVNDVLTGSFSYEAAADA